MTPKTPTHPIQTSLLNISLALEAVEHLLPDVLKGYRLAVQNKLITPKYNDARLNLIEIIVPQIRRELDALSELLTKMIESRVDKN